ncbi:Gti1/Pac2 family-domain-containing protein [Mortierella sp. GBAus27b]|nr:Gti1/Pac2 family-domain-containing protein [Mortierella sp. GBAus27b]
MAKAFHGRIEDTTDALMVFEACRQGLFPKTNRRLLAAERGEVQDDMTTGSEDPTSSDPTSSGSTASGSTASGSTASGSTSSANPPAPSSLITPGSVFVFDEEQSNIHRWTDGRIWSPSRICGNFLVYRELYRKLPTEKCRTPKEKAIMKDGSGLKDKALKEKVERDNLVVMGSMKGTFVLKTDGLIKKTMCVRGIELPSKDDLISGASKGKKDVPTSKYPTRLYHVSPKQASTFGLLRAGWRYVQMSLLLKCPH